MTRIINKKEKHRARRWRNLVALMGCVLVSACTSLGSRNVPVDQFDYNQAIGRSANQQMLLNLVRSRYRDVPVFLAVSSVLTQYVYSGSLGVNGASGRANGFNQYSIGGNAGLLYIERPTITYSPMTGEEFARELLTPIPDETIFSLFQSGWPAEELLNLTLERLNRLENVSFQPVPSTENIERSIEFRKAVRLVIELGKQKALEMERESTDSSGQRYLVFQENVSPETRQIIDELKATLDLDRKRSVFKVTQRLVRRQPDEIAIKTRSLLAMMGQLSQGVQIPEEHASEQRVELMAVSSDDTTTRLLVPLRIQSASERPADAFVAVKYQDYWFYIPHGDHNSKRIFGLLTYLFQLQAPQAPTGAPLITVPAG